MLTFGVVTAALVFGAISYADDLAPDGDGASPVATSTLDFGTVCVGQTYQDNILVGIKRAWPTTPTEDPNDPLRVFGAGATVTISIHPTLAFPNGTSHAALGAAMGADTSIVLPSNWLDTSAWPQGTIFQGDTADVNVTLTPTSTGAVATQQVSLRANGLNAFGSPIQRTVETAKVIWNAVNCDVTPPDVTINDASPNPVIVPLSGSAPNLVVKWEADEAGTYKVVLGNLCSATAIDAGATNTSGTYATANVEVTTTIPASSLAFGSNTVRVCVTDAATNTGSDAETVFKKAETRLTYDGDQYVVSPAKPTFKATLIDSTTGCNVQGKTITFYVDSNGDGVFSAGEIAGTPTTATGSPATDDSAQATLADVVLAPGVYLVKAEFAGTDECAPSNDDSIVSVVSPDDATNGGGWYHIAGETSASKRVGFGYTTRWDTTAVSYTGQIVVHNKFAWRLKGDITAFAKSGTDYPLSGTIGGHGKLYCWDAATESWKLADGYVKFLVAISDTGPPPKKGATKPDKLTVRAITEYAALNDCPSSISPLVQSALQELKGGNIHIKK